MSGVSNIAREDEVDMIPRVVLVRLTDDWEGLYVDGELRVEGPRVDPLDIEAAVPDFGVLDRYATEEQLSRWHWRCPKYIGELA